jgi:GntR family transcriptional regulator, arabinose operon transcriptional repressor
MTAVKDEKIAKYQRIYQSIKNAIASGEFSVGQRLPSESELVNSFGASRITVNRALRELQLAGIIDRRAGSGSYVRAQPERSFTFGLLIPELGQTEIFEPICRGMALAEETEHHHALLWSKALGNSELRESQATELCQRMVSEKVAGAFFAPLELTPTKDAVNQMIIETFDRAEIPIVLLDRDLVAYPARSRYDLVGIDNRRAGYAIAAHLLAVGCRRIAFICRPGSAPTVEARIAGYREAILASDGEWEPRFVQRIAPWDQDAVKEMLASVKPDGIVCANDFTAANLMKTLGALGVRVPEEIKLAGIDDVKYASLLPVPLTTIHQPCEKMGAAAVAAMVQRIHNPDLPARDILLDFHLVVRDSTRGQAQPAELAPVESA